MVNIVKPVLSETQLDKLSDLSLNLGQLFFGSLVVPFLIPSLDKPSFPVLLLGLGFTVGLWIFAIWMVKK